MRLSPWQASPEFLRFGCDLKPEDQKHVLAAYVHRFTGDHRPEWTNQLRPDRQTYPLQFLNDRDWLAHTQFVVTQAGSLDRRFQECISHPTWPNNPELRKASQEKDAQ